MATKTFKVALSLDNPRLIQTGITVHSFDRNSVKISISLTKDSQAYKIPTGASIKISLFKVNRQEQKIILDVLNTSVDSIDWIVPDYLDGYSGTVRVGVYLINGAENVDLGYFTLNSTVSDIDLMADEFTGNVLQGWEAIEEELRELNITIAQTKLDLAEDTTQVNNAIANINAKNTQVDTLASNFADNVAIKQSDATSKYNAFDTSVTQANQTIDEILALQPQLAEIEKYTKPFITFKVTTNKETIIQSIDYENNLFYSPGHGFTEGTNIWFIHNLNTMVDYPNKLLPTGLTIGATYFVRKIDDNNFALSVTLGGSYVDIAHKATVDLTKIHVESDASNINFTHLSDKRFKIVTKGRTLDHTTQSYLYITNHTADANWNRIANGSGMLRNSGAGQRLHMDGNGSVFNYSEIVLDLENNLLINYLTRGERARSDTENSKYSYTYDYIFPTDSNLSTNFLGLYFWKLANGSVIEVYKI